MARPRSKSDLLDQAKGNYEKLISFVEDIPLNEQERDFPEGTLNRNIKDILAHLHAWHLMLLDWYTVGMSGEKPNMPAKGHTWRTLPDLNKEIQKRYAQVKLGDAKGLLRQSYKTVLKIIEMHTDEELFAKKKYHWTGSTSLGAYLISATSSHYDWAFKLIKKAKKEEAIL
ncbi:MAG: ClbS/DfsB family four-helix bundle protein [Bacteroidota bacterium]